MGYKTISLSEEAYKRLVERKNGNESFSDVILRLTNNSTLRDFVGIVNGDLINELEFNLSEIRKNRSSEFFKKINADWS